MVTGAASAWPHWLAQRATALLIALCSLKAIGYLVVAGPMSFEAWERLFTLGWVRIGTMLFAVSIAWHAFLGMRDIFLDYVKHDGLRFALHCALFIAVLAFVIRAASVLWRA